MFHVPEQYRLILPKSDPYHTTKSDGNNGAFSLPPYLALSKLRIMVIASDGEGWEHVSASTKSRCPTWEEMCYVKDLFWDGEDCVVQYHPAKEHYVNNHPYTLHLWRSVAFKFPIPPMRMV